MLLVPEEAREGFGSLPIGVTDSCELPCGFWELNPEPIDEQTVLLPTESSLLLHEQHILESTVAS